MVGAIGIAGLLSACGTVERMLDRVEGDAGENSPPRSQSHEPGTIEEPRVLGRIGDFNAVQPPAPEVAPPSLPMDGAGDADKPEFSPPTGTFAGDKALQIAAEVERLRETLKQRTAERAKIRDKVATAMDDYRTAIADASDGGSARNLAESLPMAEAHLNGVSDSTQQMEALRSKIVADAALAGYLAEQAEAAAKVAGVVEEDRRRLDRLEAEASESRIAFKELLGEVDDDILRQSAHVTRERRDFNALAAEVKDDKLYRQQADTSARVADVRASDTRTAGLEADGGPAVSRVSAPPAGKDAPPLPPSPPPMTAAAPVPPPAPPAISPELVSREPVVSIGFAEPDVDYEAALYAAVSEAVARNPSASFEVVAVSAAGRPGASLAEAKRHAERVRQSLINMGVPAGRLTQSARTTEDAGSDRVLVFMM